MENNLPIKINKYIQNDESFELLTYSINIFELL